ncbi:MAG: hypothetical protein IKS93_05740 [Methanobrevibacter sp.]|nr:hypothetical protein [Methanobrevibacter sp.]
MVIAIDFDGCLTTKNCFPEISELRPYALEAVHNLQAAGHKCILWTCREGYYLDKAREFLNTNGIEMDGYNFSPYQLQSRKIVADVYIDDKNVFMVDDVDWKKIEEYILSLNKGEVKIVSYN